MSKYKIYDFIAPSSFFNRGVSTTSKHNPSIIKPFYRISFRKMLRDTIVQTLFIRIMKSCLNCETKADFPDLQGIAARYEDRQRILHKLIGIESKRLTCYSSKSIYFEHKNELVEIIFEDENNHNIDYRTIMNPCIECTGEGAWEFMQPMLPLVNIYYLKTTYGANLVFTLSLNTTDYVRTHNNPLHLRVSALHPPNSFTSGSFK